VQKREQDIDIAQARIGTADEEGAVGAVRRDGDA
jgi:hypothetical protein